MCHYRVNKNVKPSASESANHKANSSVSKGAKQCPSQGADKVSTLTSVLFMLTLVCYTGFSGAIRADALASSKASTKLTLGNSNHASDVKGAADLMLRFDKPGTDWESHSLPIGNGALGATVLGGVHHDVIQFSEKSLWTGGPNSVAGYDFGLPSLDEKFPEKIANVQQQLQQKVSLPPKSVVKTLGREVIGYGSYQSFADINLTFDHQLEDVSHYQRSLDINTAVAKVSYQLAGVEYTREYFVSYPDQVIVIKLSSSAKNQLNVAIDLSVPNNRSLTKNVIVDSAKHQNKHNQHQINSAASTQIFGTLTDNGLAYEGQLHLSADGGKITKNSNNTLQVTGANSVWLVVAAATNYQQSYPTYRGKMPHQQVTTSVNHAISFNYAQLKQRHSQDHQRLFNRVNLDLAHQLPHTPTNELLAQYKAGTSSATANRALERLYYQFGRYLLISSSRAGSLPANLQGVWNKHQHAPWSADYHVNINLQMNYWLADMTNLSETNIPLFDFIEGLVEPGEISAQKIFGVDGWVMFLNTNVWGFTGPIAWPTAFWQPEGAAWMSLHFYEHYLFTKDESFLQHSAYPVLKKASEFWLNTLVFDQASQQYFVSPSYSPEHGDFTVGAAMSQQIVAKLLDSTLNAAKLLADHEMIARLTAVTTKLNAGLALGNWGQIKEWQQDLDDNSSSHRHVSHLFALHPSNSISPLTTPELAQGAAVTLNARGDGGTGWSKAWKINFWARLFDGNHAHKLLAEQLKHSTLDNLWDNHPPFQIDGNFGATAGITEMLLQSQNNEIHLLPALPEKWPQGAISGLKARGNILVNISWQAGKLANAHLLSASTQMLNVRAASLNKSSQIIDDNGNAIVSHVNNNVIRFRAEKNIRYQLLP